MPDRDTSVDEREGGEAAKLDEKQLALLTEKFQPDVRFKNPHPLKRNSLEHLGTQRRLARIFPDGKTVMVAGDHNYLLNDRIPRPDLLLGETKLAVGADCLMCTIGELKQLSAEYPELMSQTVCIRVGGTPGIKQIARSRTFSGNEIEVLRDKVQADLKEAIGKSGGTVSSDEVADALDERIAEMRREHANSLLADEFTTIGDWPVEYDVSMMAVQIYGGSEHQKSNLVNLTLAEELGERFKIPVMAVTAVGTDMAKDGDFFREMIAMLQSSHKIHCIKTYSTEDSKFTCAMAQVPLVRAGGQAGAEDKTLVEIQQWMDAGGSGVDMGRNLFEARKPIAMLDAVHAVVHKGVDASAAYKDYEKRLGE